MGNNKEKIDRFTSGEFSFNDYLAVNSLFQKEEFNEDLEKIMGDDWAGTDNSCNNQEGLLQVLNRLHVNINQDITNRERTFDFYRLFSKIAVVLLIPALITIAVLSYLTISPIEKAEAWVEIHSPIGSRTKFQLPDGTQGWLNSGSSIKYPVNFMKHRSVGISGEAWFDVVHLKSEEFRVITPWFDVKVLGTQFNVLAYDNEPTAEVTLEQGKVLVLGKDHEVRGELSPDQQLVFTKSKKEFIKTSIDAKSYTSWKDGLLIFKNVSIADMAKRLERRYNAEIILHGDSLKSAIFRATFQDENLEEICKMFATVAPVRYKIHKREIQPDGTFAKGKIEIWLKKSINFK
jgi:ferric-dicitrate binding protein FerR (iron transport regulator)